MDQAGRKAKRMLPRIIADARQKHFGIKIRKLEPTAIG
jgi:hypothetical protein